MTAEVHRRRPSHPPLFKQTEIGDIPGEWELARLGAITSESAFGPRFPATHYDPSGNFGTLRTTDITADWTINYRTIPRAKLDDQFRNHILRDGDLLVTRSGTCGVVCVFNTQEVDVIPGAFLIRFRLNERADPHFVRLAMMARGAQARIQSMAAGGVQKNLSGTNLAQLPLPLPPLSEQRKINAIIASVDQAIEATQAVFDQLDVVKHAMMAELLTRGLPRRHTRFQQTEIGEMPEDWTLGSLRDFASLSSGGTPSRDRPDFWNGGIPWVKTGEITYGVITHTEETISAAGLQNSAARVLPTGTLLMAMYGQGATRGRVAMLGIAATVNQACLAISPAPGMSARFLFHVLSSRYDALRTLGHEGTQKNLNAKLVGEILIPKPPLDEQSEIVEILDAVKSRREREMALSEQLGALKSALMSVLLTGEVRVKPDEEAAA